MIDISEIQQALKEEGLDGWLFFDHHQRDPLAYRILKLGSNGMATRRWYYFIPAEGEPTRLVHRIESGMLDAVPGTKIVYSGWNTQLAGLQQALGGAKRIAMEYSPKCAIPYVAMVDAGTIELVRSLGVDIVTSANLVQLFEARWSSDQLQSHLEAGKRVDAARQGAFKFIRDTHKAGTRLTEWDVNRHIRTAFEKDGLYTDHGPIVAVNENMSDPHYEPQPERCAEIRPGDAVLIDMWAKLDKPGSVYYDITWTGFCGEVIPAELNNIFEVVRGGRDRAIERVKSAISAGEKLEGFQVDDAAREYITAQGYGDYFVHRTGHSIGEEVHGTGANMDNLETHDERLVIARTCFSIEPGVYLPRFGVRSEVNMYVGEKEARVTGEIQTEMIRII